ncbi:MAG: BBP7 family outer membrane beta-barrel protein [Planctomycetota bacterium]|nr:BBP7 family outer membrane beta-barrel protein [Planctomycetota bacterium]
MSTCRVALMASLCLLSSISLALAQSESDATAPRTPGFQHGEKFIGFVPAHLKGKPDQPRFKKIANETSPGSGYESSENVTTVAYEEHILGEPPLPPGFEREVIEFSEDVKGGKLWSGDSSCCWMRAEYLWWWTQGMNTPPLVTTSPAGTPQAQAGVLGQPGTTILFGNDDLADHARSGARFTIGKWLDPAHCNGIEVNYLTLGSETDAFNAGLNQFNILARPFFDTVGAAEDSRLIAFPGLVQGTMNVAASTELQGLEVLYRRQGCGSWGCHIDWVVGYRFAELKDRLRIDESTASLTGPTAGTTFDLFDQFDTRNTFHGAEFGLVGDWQIDNCWSCDAFAKVAIGGTTYRAGVAGQTVTTDVAGASTTAQRGLLAQGTNIGSYQWDDFAAMSEFGITLRRELNCGLAATFGYNFLYWSNVARAGEQVDTTVNTSQIPLGNLVGTARPAFPQRTDDFWAQGLRFGLEYRY